jgi:hypothetical protein
MLKLSCWTIWPTALTLSECDGFSCRALRGVLLKIVNEVISSPLLKLKILKFAQLRQLAE